MNESVLLAQTGIIVPQNKYYCTANRHYCEETGRISPPNGSICAMSRSASPKRRKEVEETQAPKAREISAYIAHQESDYAGRENKRNYRSRRKGLGMRRQKVGPKAERMRAPDSNHPNGRNLGLEGKEADG